MISMSSAQIGVSGAAGLASRAIGRLGSSVEQAGEMGRTWEGHAVRVIVAEKYFMRIGSFASLTIMVSGDAASSRVDAIASGAGDGLLNFNWGAREDFEEDFRKEMRELGYA